MVSDFSLIPYTFIKQAKGLPSSLASFAAYSLLVNTNCLTNTKALIIAMFTFSAFLFPLYAVCKNISAGRLK